jgi:putative endonuclease
LAGKLHGAVGCGRLALAMAHVQERWFVYVARCADGTLYTGTARDVRARIAAHNAGRGARYTRGRAPLVLCGQQRCKSQGDALRLEWAIKRLPRDAKLALFEARGLSQFARRLLHARGARSRASSRSV